MRGAPWLCLLVVTPIVLASAPSTGQTPVAGTLAPTATLRIGADANLSFRPDDGGYGRIVLVADEPVDLTLSVDDDLDPGVYDDSNFTFIELVGITDRLNTTGWSFSWWGDPYHSWWPERGWDEDDTPLHLDTGEHAALVVANTVDGYTITVTGTEPGPSGGTHDWPLAPHTDLHLLRPERQDGRISTDVLAAGEQRWEAPVHVAAHSRLLAVSWIHNEGPGVHIATGWDEHGFRTAEPGEPVPGRPGGETSVGTGDGGSGSQWTTWSLTSEDADLVAFRERTTADLTTKSYDTGAQFYVIPLGPLDA